MILTSLLLVLSVVVIVPVSAADDLLKVFNWDLKNCADFPFAVTDGKFYKCGELEYCAVDLNLKGYRQAGTKDPCRSPGPQFRVQPGRKYLLSLKNTVVSDDPNGDITNIHTHGLHISGDGNADNIVRLAASGECIHYVWDMPANHMGGTNWYHSHKHTLSHVQVTTGAVGMIVVEDDYAALLPISLSGRTSIQTFLQNEQSIMGAKILGTWHGNGNSAGATITIKQNEWTRLRIGISNPDQASASENLQPVSVECIEAYAIAYDGVYVTSIPGTKLPKSITGSSRIDVAVKCDSTGEKLVRYGNEIIGRLNIVAGTPNTGSPYTSEGTIWSPTRPNYLRDLRSEPVNNVMTVDLANLRINGAQWDEANAMAQHNYGEVNQWNVTGSFQHPLHLHIHHFQIVGPCGSHEIGQFYDTIAGFNSCLVRFAYDDYAGFTVLHCHDLAHEDCTYNIFIYNTLRPIHTCFLIYFHSLYFSLSGNYNNAIKNKMLHAAGMMTWFDITGGNGVVATNPDPNEKVCYSKVTSSNSCSTRKDMRCNGTGRFIRLGRPGSWFCQQRCVKNYDSFTNRRFNKWSCGKCVN
jgi:suppressor of ftsI